MSDATYTCLGTYTLEPWVNPNEAYMFPTLADKLEAIKRSGYELVNGKFIKIS